jgi:hypothetical protein
MTTFVMSPSSLWLWTKRTTCTDIMKLEARHETFVMLWKDGARIAKGDYDTAMKRFPPHQSFNMDLVVRNTERLVLGAMVCTPPILLTCTCTDILYKTVVDSRPFALTPLFFAFCWVRLTTGIPVQGRRTCEHEKWE